MAREFINRIQNFRKESGFSVTDRIAIRLESTESVKAAIKEHKEFICNEVLAESISFESIYDKVLITDIETEGDTKIVLKKV